jgi:hypothetical protein
VRAVVGAIGDQAACFHELAVTVDGRRGSI